MQSLQRALSPSSLAGDLALLCSTTTSFSLGGSGAPASTVNVPHFRRDRVCRKTKIDFKAQRRGARRAASAQPGLGRQRGALSSAPATDSGTTTSRTTTVTAPGTLLLSGSTNHPAFVEDPVSGPPSTRPTLGGPPDTTSSAEVGATARAGATAAPPALFHLAGSSSPPAFYSEAAKALFATKEASTEDSDQPAARPTTGPSAVKIPDNSDQGVVRTTTESTSQQVQPGAISQKKIPGVSVQKPKSIALSTIQRPRVGGLAAQARARFLSENAGATSVGRWSYVFSPGGRANVCLGRTTLEGAKK